MRHEDWRETDRLRRMRNRGRGSYLEDYGQADYSDRYGYDPVSRSGYRTFDDQRDPYRQAEPSSWEDARHERRREREMADVRRRGSSDRVLWAVIAERLEDVRGLDLHDVELTVRDAEVTLDGAVRHKADRRRIEDIADIDGVRHVQNNLRVRDRSPWFLF